ncbi:unnamed protein product [Colias eurytheme]|nr:unnamed protein product [Colias eurytheme]
MSLSSHKSFNEDVNEIFERSCSIKSASEESQSSDDDDNLSQELLKKLTPSVLSKLRKCFKKAKEKRARDLDKKVEEVMRVAAAEEGIEFPARVQTSEEQVYMNESGFVAAVDSIMGSHKYTPHARTLYRTLDRFQTGRVSWSQLVARLVAGGARATASRADTWHSPLDGGIVKLEHCKRETLVTLVAIEREDSFSYVGVSRGGRVALYTPDFKLIKAYEIFYHRTGVRRRVRNCWITDAVYMHDSSSIVYSASDRSLTIYDVSTITHTPLYCITGLPNIPTCLAYSRAGGACAYPELYLGTERGDITCIRFLQPRVSLLHVKTPDTINYYFWMELSTPPHSTYVSLRSWRAHGRSVRRVMCERDGALVLSCSRDAATSLRMKYVAGTLDDYVIGVHRGVTCFHATRQLTACGAHSSVRLHAAAQRAHAELRADTALVDVRVLESDNIVIGYCVDCSIYIWDIYEECLLQKIKIKFPFLGVLGKKVEFGTRCIHLGPPRKKVQKRIVEDPNKSRRGSSVYEGSTGGLILQPEHDDDSDQNASYERTEVLFTCSDSVYILRLRESNTRTSSHMPQEQLVPHEQHVPHVQLVPHEQPFIDDPHDRHKPETHEFATQTPSLRDSPSLQVPTMPFTQTYDLDELIKNAGLENILEKNFVLMQGLKHDLNKKLFEMESTVEARKSAVSACAPHLALANRELDPLPTFDRLADRHTAVQAYFPGPSVNVTPTGSQSTTPRNKIN